MKYIFNLIIALNLCSVLHAACTAAFYATVRGVWSPASLTSLTCSLLGFRIQGVSVAGYNSDDLADEGASTFFKSFACQLIPTYCVSRLLGYSDIGAAAASIVAPLGWLSARYFLKSALRQGSYKLRLGAAAACVATIGVMGGALNHFQMLPGGG